MASMLKRPSGDGYFDLEHEQAGQGYVIKFFHIPSGRTVQFKALITQFSDQYESSWKSEDVYGRNDPIENFQGTKRTIALGWDVVAASLEEAQLNLQKCGLLFTMLYPVYTKGNNAGSISTSPLFKVKFANLIQSATGRPVEKASATATKKRVKAGGGLVCRLSGFTYEPDLEQGMFDPSRGILYPQAINLQTTLTVFHTHGLGWNSVGTPRAEGFPYGEDLPSLGKLTKAGREQRATKAHKLMQQRQMTEAASEAGEVAYELVESNRIVMGKLGIGEK